MLVEIKIFSSLRHYVLSSEKHLEGDKWDIPEGTTVSRALKMLNLPQKEVKILLINGRHGDKERVLKEGDVFHVFPPMMGG
ncbi:MAG: MoaD/ThiS family protein [Proteobacteria bacterium]|nr:MoaD/ThiS family protein [Pseudomonadota bacterium]